MRIRSGAVPEHFFFPWKLWLKSVKPTESSLEWIWEEFPAGSGAMLQALKEDKIDLAFLLTESALLAKSKGADIEILCPFVKSPLPWGIFTGASNPISKVEEGETIAISRFQSGSHLMAMLEAGQRGKEISPDQWKLVENLEGARLALSTGTADLFFWEKWTTKPLVDAGEFKMLSVFPSPWPAFVLCASRKTLIDPSTKDKILHDVRDVCLLAQSLKKNPLETANLISVQYQQKREDVLEWLDFVEWANADNLSLHFLEEAEAKLRQAGLINQVNPG
jgi:sulfonate transport system substrate-binding protein